MKGLILIGVTDVLIRQNLANYLKLHRFETCFAEDGISLVATVMQRRPDAMVIERILPAGDVFIRLRQAKSANPTLDIPMIVIAGANSALATSASFDAGARMFLHKPINGQILLTALAQLLGPRQQASDEFEDVSLAIDPNYWSRQSKPHVPRFGYASV
jgi:DNA-binding response OmpR family regulator